MEDVANINRILGKRLKEERKANNLKQKDIEQHIKIEHGTLSKIENLKSGRYISVKQLKQLSELLNVSADYLIGNVDSKEIENLEISRALGVDDNSVNLMRKLDKQYKNVINYFFEKSPFEIWELLSCSNIMKEMYNKFNSLIEYLDKCILNLKCIKDYYPVIKEFIEPEDDYERRCIKGEFEEESQEEKDQLSQLLYYYRALVMPLLSETKIRLNQDMVDIFNHITYKYTKDDLNRIEKLVLILKDIENLYLSAKNKYKTIFDTVNNLYDFHLEQSIKNIPVCIEKQKYIHSREIYDLRNEVIKNKEKIKKVNVILSFEVTQKISSFMDIK